MSPTDRVKIQMKYQENDKKNVNIKTNWIFEIIYLN
jgi:hypothetical protein